MNEQELKLIEEMASKLGTTTEYLWSILLKQAYISGITDLVYYAAMIVFGVVLWKAHAHFSNDDNKWSYYEKDDSLIIPMGVIFILYAVAGLVCFFSIGNTVTALIHPEYYALDEILEALK